MTWNVYATLAHFILFDQLPLAAQWLLAQTRYSDTIGVFLSFFIGGTRTATPILCIYLFF
jgi:hypothetical protein